MANWQTLFFIKISIWLMIGLQFTHGMSPKFQNIQFWPLKSRDKGSLESDDEPPFTRLESFIFKMKIKYKNSKDVRENKKMKIKQDEFKLLMAHNYMNMSID